MRLRESLNLRSNYFCRSIIFMYFNKIEILTCIIFNRHKFAFFFLSFFSFCWLSVRGGTMFGTVTDREGV